MPAAHAVTEAKELFEQQQRQSGEAQEQLRGAQTKFTSCLIAVVDHRRSSDSAWERSPAWAQ